MESVLCCEEEEDSECSEEESAGCWFEYWVYFEFCEEVFAFVECFAECDCEAAAEESEECVAW